MRSVIRKPSIKKSVSAKTTGKVTRTIKKATNPTYGKKGTGYIHDPKKAVYNQTYNKSSISTKDVMSPKSNSKKRTSYSQGQNNNVSSRLVITNSNLYELVSEHPEIIEILHKNFIEQTILGVLFLIIGIPVFMFIPLIGVAIIGIAIYVFYKSHKFHLAYNDANRYYWDNKRY